MADYLPAIALAIFLISVIAFIASAYGLGVTDEDKTSPAYNASLSFIIISSVTLIVSWFMAWKLKIPLDPIRFENYFAQVK